MPNGRNEPECWTCKYFGENKTLKICEKHLIVLPIAEGPYLICRDWEHYENSNKTITWWKDNFLKEAILYKYNLYQTSPPNTFKKFSELPSISPTR